MSIEQQSETLSYPSIKHRLRTLIEITATPLFSMTQAQELVKNLHDDLVLIKVSLEQLNEKSSRVPTA